MRQPMQPKWKAQTEGEEPERAPVDQARGRHRHSWRQKAMRATKARDLHPGWQSVQGHVRDSGTREHCGHLRAFHAKKQPTLTKGFRVSECREHAPRPRCAAGSHTVCLPLYGRILMPDEHRSILCKGVSQRRTGRYERVTRGCHSPLTAPKCGCYSCV